MMEYYKSVIRTDLDLCMSTWIVANYCIIYTVGSHLCQEIDIKCYTFSMKCLYQSIS